MAVININGLLRLLLLESDKYRDDNRSNHRAIRCPCPLHQGEDYNFWIDLDNEGYQCHSICHRGGKLTDLIAEVRNISKIEAYKLLLNSNIAHIEKDHHSHKTREDPSKPLEASKIPLPKGIRLSIPYKGIEPKFLDLFSIYMATTVPWQNWYIFPIHNEIGEYVGFQGRRGVDYIEPKYKFAYEFPKSKIVYNYHRSKPYEILYIFEGIKSVVLAYQHGLKNTVALLGSSINDKHIYLLKNHRLILCLDNDEAGNNGTKKLQRVNLSIEKVIKLSPELAFDELSQEQHMKFLHSPWTSNQ